ncbi:MAG: HAD-IA family hydrolase [Emcibacteraceae bacterium]|nr:HAD-IA family hydrolase [Emcibacteraceae bacterium]
MSDPLKLAIFDCDGTLVDGQHMIISAMKYASDQCRIPYPGDEPVRRIVGLSLLEAISRVYPTLTDGDHQLIRTEFIEHFQHLRTLEDHNEPLYEGIKEVILELSDMGVLLGVATGKSTRGLKNTLLNHGLTDHFVTLNTADDGPGKPHPSMINVALSDAGVERENAFMIGDTTYDMVMAKNAGVRSVGVTWGYHPEDELVTSGADHIINHISEFIELVKA